MTPESPSTAPEYSLRRLILMKPETAAFALAAFFLAAFNGAFWHRFMTVVAPASLYDWLFVAAVGCVLFLLLALLFGLVNGRYVFKPVAILLILTSAAAAYFMSEFGIVIDHDMVTNVFQTDRGEAGDLITLKFVLWMLALGVLPSLLVTRIRLEPRPLVQELRFKALSGGVILVASAAMVFPFFMNITSVFREHSILKHEIVPFNFLSAISKSTRIQMQAKASPVVRSFGTDAAKGASWPQRQGKSLTVLVVGETARAKSFSLNGYDRPTNTRLAEVPGIISMSNATSCGTATAQSLPCMFSGVGRANSHTMIANEQQGLLDVLQRAGLSVWWRDNQAGCKGVCSRVPNENIMPPEPKKFYELAISYDDKLVQNIDPWIDQIPDGGVLVLHMMGSHGPAYYKRYPREHAKFTPDCQDTQFSRCTREALVNAYDNTIAYTDHVLRLVVDKLAERDAQGWATSMIYVSDHGESVGENGIYLHGLPYAIAPEEQKRVPWIMWFSPKFQASFGVSGDCLARRRAEPVSHDNYYHSILGLLDVKTSTYDTTLDMFSPCRTKSVTQGR